jgi:hypothetical protein
MWYFFVSKMEREDFALHGLGANVRHVTAYGRGYNRRKKCSHANGVQNIGRCACIILVDNGVAATSNEEKVATSDDGMIVPDFHNKKLKGEDMEVAILQLYKNQYVKKEDIAKKLGKSENYLRNKILQGCVR